MPQLTFMVQSPPQALGVPALPQLARLSDNAQGILFFAGSLVACGFLVWALSLTSAPTALDGVSLLRGAKGGGSRKQAASPPMRSMETIMREIDQAELVDLWHLSRTALAGKPAGVYERKLWVSREYEKAHPDISSTAAYKALERFHIDRFTR